MATTISNPRTTCLPTHWSLADIQNHLGGIPYERIRSSPPPGYATVEDVEDLSSRNEPPCELIDGILVEKTMGWYESVIAGWIITAINNYLMQHPIGKALTADGALRILPACVRIPDACFIGRSQFPAEGLPREPIPNLVPDLAIEVISQSNTPREMEQKRQDYFQAGVCLVWYIDPPTRSATVYTSADDPGTLHTENEPLSGENVLPDFQLSLAEIFRLANQDFRP
jgi:Uma2 family endonuclease